METVRHDKASKYHQTSNWTLACTMSQQTANTALKKYLPTNLTIFTIFNNQTANRDPHTQRVFVTDLFAFDALQYPHTS